MNTSDRFPSTSELIVAVRFNVPMTYVVNRIYGKKPLDASALAGHRGPPYIYVGAYYFTSLCENGSLLCRQDPKASPSRIGTSQLKTTSAPAQAKSTATVVVTVSGKTRIQARNAHTTPLCLFPRHRLYSELLFVHRKEKQGPTPSQSILCIL